MHGREVLLLGGPGVVDLAQALLLLRGRPLLPGPDLRLDVEARLHPRLPVGLPNARVGLRQLLRLEAGALLLGRSLGALRLLALPPLLQLEPALLQDLLHQPPPRGVLRFLLRVLLRVLLRGRLLDEAVPRAGVLRLSHGHRLELALVLLGLPLALLLGAVLLGVLLRSLLHRHADVPAVLLALLGLPLGVHRRLELVEGLHLPHPGHLAVALGGLRGRGLLLGPAPLLVEGRDLRLPGRALRLLALPHTRHLLVERPDHRRVVLPGLSLVLLVPALLLEALLLPHAVVHPPLLLLHLGQHRRLLQLLLALLDGHVEELLRVHLPHRVAVLPEMTDHELVGNLLPLALSPCRELPRPFGELLAALLGRRPAVEELLLQRLLLVKKLVRKPLAPRVQGLLPLGPQLLKPAVDHPLLDPVARPLLPIGYASQLALLLESFFKSCEFVFVGPNLEDPMIGG
mmetsp:Transcript_21633/g.51683  ORF Transcript_21633/g.51683 Transcript_21633/m.51683 type:complete len:458 (-) Transcript_21633:259-1632(-)